MIAALMLSSPMVLLATIPFSQQLATVLAIAVPVGLIFIFVSRAPVIQMHGDELVVGRMRLPLSALGSAEYFQGDRARFERGPGLSPGSQRLFRGDIDGVVKINITDPQDPTDYLLFSSRKGAELVSALRANLA
jgi:hypothetical protein